MTLEKLTHEEIENYRDEARYRDPTFNYDSFLNNLLEIYQELEGKDIKKTIEKQYNAYLKEMLMENFSPGCIGFYQKLYEYTKAEDEYGR